MIKRLLNTSLILISGLFLIIFPAFLGYFNKDSLSFDFATFLIDYPIIRYVLGIILILTGIFDILYLFCFRKLQKVFVIQEGGDGDYGALDLHFSKIIKGENDEIIYTNLATNTNHSKDVVSLEKKHIKDFYEKLPKQKTLSFLGIATIPSLVYSGYIVGEGGRRVNYYHWNREKCKACKLRGVRKRIKLHITKEIINTDSTVEDCVLYVSISYPPNKELIRKQFSGYNIIFLDSNNFGTDIVKTKHELFEITNTVRKTISNKCALSKRVHLILQCSSEVCFAIGQKLKSPGLPKIRVYNYNAKNKEKPWDWYIDLE